MKLLCRIAFVLMLWIVADYALSWVLQMGVEKSFGLNQHSQILVIGHSHIMLGVDKSQLEAETGCRVTKYSRTGVGLQERHLMTRQYLESEYSDSLKIAILGVDCFSFQKRGLSSNCYTLFYPFFDDPNVDRYLSEQASVLDYWQHRLIRLSRYSDDLINQAMRGWMGDDRNYKTSCMDTDEFHRHSGKWLRDIDFDPFLMQQLDETIAMLRQRGVKVLLVNTPTYAEINRHQPERYERIMEHFRLIADTDSSVWFVDFNLQYEDSVQYMFDPVHLNVDGQRLITQKLANLVSKRLREQ